MNFVYHDDWLSFVFRLIWRTQVKPTLNQYFALLCAPGSLGSSSTMAAITALELSGDGYVRQPVSATDDGVLVGGEWVDEFVNLSWTVTAAKQWQHLVILANANSTPGNTTGVIVAVGSLANPETLIANTPRVIKPTLGAKR